MGAIVGPCRRGDGRQGGGKGRLQAGASPGSRLPEERRALGKRLLDRIAIGRRRRQEAQAGARSGGPAWAWRRSHPERRAWRDRAGLARRPRRGGAPLPRRGPVRGQAPSFFEGDPVTAGAGVKGAQGEGLAPLGAQPRPEFGQGEGGGEGGCHACACPVEAAADGTARTPTRLALCNSIRQCSRSC